MCICLMRSQSGSVESNDIRNDMNTGLRSGGERQEPRSAVLKQDTTGEH